MTRFKKPKSKKKPVTLTQAQIKQIKADITDQSITCAMCLFIAYMMEEEEIQFDADRICSMIDGIDRWASAIDDHIISLNDVAKIIEEHTGMQVKW